MVSYYSKMNSRGGGNSQKRSQSYNASKPYSQQMKQINPATIRHTRKTGVEIKGTKK